VVFVLVTIDEYGFSVSTSTDVSLISDGKLLKSLYHETC